MNPVTRLSLLIGVFVSSNHVFAAGKFDLGEDKYLTVGVGTIASYQSIENAAEGGESRTNDLKLNSARLIVNGSLNQYIKGMFRTERLSATNDIEVIDANIQLALTPNLTVWAGRHLSPSDRANMSGPYNSMGGGFWAGVASRYAAYGGYVGRDDGITIVGRALDQRLHYSIGAFKGKNIYRFANIGALDGSPKSKDNLMYAGRLQYDFWDVEAGYYGTANYFGRNNILSIGLAGRLKKDGAVNASSSSGDYKSSSLDLLLEKTDIGPGAVSMEAAYYYYDTDDIFLGEQGTSYLGGVGYILNKKVGWGQLMPFVRYQHYSADGITNPLGINTAVRSERTKVDYGLNYVIEPYNAMISAVYSNSKTTGFQKIDAINVLMQFQY